eukprot:9793296-Alexandrium_andersonii.AAC.1
MALMQWAAGSPPQADAADAPSGAPVGAAGHEDGKRGRQEHGETEEQMALGAARTAAHVATYFNAEPDEDLARALAEGEVEVEWRPAPATPPAAPAAAGSAFLPLHGPDALVLRAVPLHAP